ncbi:MAG: hypothetical protein PHS31_08180 [Victivallaceae bacterium]|nr:hypothetical protein [Victivallaceae bacterium]
MMDLKDGSTNAIEDIKDLTRKINELFKLNGSTEDLIELRDKISEIVMEVLLEESK